MKSTEYDGPENASVSDPERLDHVRGITPILTPPDLGLPPIGVDTPYTVGTVSKWESFLVRSDSLGLHDR